MNFTWYLYISDYSSTFYDFHLFNQLIDQKIKEWLFQLIIVGLPEKMSLLDWATLNNYKFAGFIFYRRNFNQPQDLANLIKILKEINGYNTFFVLDEEPGGATRLGLFSYLPKNQPLTFQDLLLYEKSIKDDLKLLKSIGINFITSPLIDWPSTNGRHLLFQTLDDQKLFATTFINWASAYKIFTLLKHYPNLGFCSSDLHHQLCEIDFDIFKTSWHQTFEHLLNLSNFVMLSHIKVKSLDNLPFSLSLKSKEALNQRLTLSNLNFQGFFITDDLSAMESLTFIEPVERIILALQAQNLIIWSHDFKSLIAFQDQLLERIKNKNLKKVVYEMFLRVQKFKNLTKDYF